MSSDLDIMDQSDSGGVGAKKGFLYQDLAAAYYVTQMLLDKRIKAVRCEVTDDIDIIYDSYVESVQVKTTDKDSKWSLKEFTETSKKTDKKKPKPTDSILHKSLDCDKLPDIKTVFRILSPRDVNHTLQYLSIEKDKRESKSGRDALLKSLSNKLKSFTSANDNDVEYWIDNAYWEVIPSKRELILESINLIHKYANSISYSLDPDRDVKRILAGILYTVTKQSAESKKINTADDKTYTRSDLIKWIDIEIEELESKSPKKAYRRINNPLKSPLLELIDLSNQISCPLKNGKGLKQGYQKRTYRFKHISKTLKEWLPEVLLTPNQLVDSHLYLLSKFKNFIDKIDSNSPEYKDFVGRLLLHTIIRDNAKSQPIPATLFIDNEENCKQFDNVHIIPLQDSKDELWMGISELVELNNVKTQIETVCKRISEAIDDIDSQRSTILDVKDDNYLVHNDINELLDTNYPLDEFLDRFKFIVFIGYDTEHLNIQGSNTEDEDKLIEEVKIHFQYFFDKLINQDNYCDELQFNLYLYPTPCIKTMLKSFEEELKGEK